MISPYVLSRKERVWMEWFFLGTGIFIFFDIYYRFIPMFSEGGGWERKLFLCFAIFTFGVISVGSLWLGWILSGVRIYIYEKRCMCVIRSHWMFLDLAAFFLAYDELHGEDDRRQYESGYRPTFSYPWFFNIIADYMKEGNLPYGIYPRNVVVTYLEWRKKKWLL